MSMSRIFVVRAHWNILDTHFFREPTASFLARSLPMAEEMKRLEVFDQCFEIPIHIWVEAWVRVWGKMGDGSLEQSYKVWWS